MLQYDGSGNFRVLQARRRRRRRSEWPGPARSADGCFRQQALMPPSWTTTARRSRASIRRPSYMTVTLPPVGAITAGWTIAVASDNSKSTSVQVNGGGGEKILVPGTLGAQNSLSLSSNTSGYELVTLQFDGSNFRVLEHHAAHCQCRRNVGADRHPGIQLGRVPNRRAAVGRLLSLFLQCAEYLEARRSFQLLAAEQHPMPQGGTRVPFTASSLGRLFLEAQHAGRVLAGRAACPRISRSPAACGIFRSASIRFTSRAPTSRSPLPSCARSPTATILPVWQSRRARISWRSSTGRSSRG